VFAPELTGTPDIPQEYNTPRYMFVNGVAGILFARETPPKIVRAYIPLRINGKFVKRQ